MRLRPFTMRTKILLSCLACLVVALVMQMVLFQQYSGRIIYQQAQKASESALNTMQNDLYALFKSAENSLLNLYMDKQLMNDLQSDKAASELANAHQSTAYNLAYSAFDASQNLIALYLYTQDHQLVSGYRHAQTPMYSYPADIYDGTMPNNEEAVRAYAQSDETAMLISGYYNPKRGVNLVRHVLKLRASGGQSIGYAVCDLSPKAYDALLAKYRYSQDQVIWLQRAGHPVVLHNGGGDKLASIYIGCSASIESASPLSLPGGYELFQAAQRKYSMNAYLLMPQSVLTENQSAINRVTITVCALIALVFSLLYLILSRSLTNPLTAMVNAMRQIKKGHTQLRLMDLRKDEFGQLGTSFNEMLDQLEVHTQRSLSSQLMLNDLKYKALQAQINPHFLYNTLDTMGGIASVQHADMVAVLCRALSAMFRYSLDMQGAFATLDDELAHLRNYLLIINIRTLNSIVFDIDIPEALLDAQLPRLTLQPLVENAVTHGLKNKRGEKRVVIRARRTPDALLVTVEDNGVGMDVQKINSLLQSDDSDALNRADSIGLSNIHARLRLLLGPDSGITVAEAEGGGSMVTLWLRGEMKSHG